MTFNKKDSTKGMLTHKCILDSAQKLKFKQSKLTSLTDQRCLPVSVRNELTTQLVKFVAKDLQPFSVVSGDGFTSLCQLLVNVGAKDGQADISKELPDRTILSRNIMSVEKSKSTVCAEMSSCEHVALTSDGWTDEFRKVAYLSVTAHYFDDEMNLRSCILDAGSLEERKTGEVLSRKNYYGIP